MAKKLTVLICDDLPSFRGFVRTLLSRIPGLHVVGEAVDGRDAVDRAAQLHPDVVLMDIEMPQMNGIQATRRLKEIGVASKVVMLSLYKDRELAKYAEEVGADGYLPKEYAVAHLSRAIEAVCKGQKYWVAA